jgi:hypothetical protein
MQEAASPNPVGKAFGSYEFLQRPRHSTVVASRKHRLVFLELAKAWNNEGAYLQLQSLADLSVSDFVPRFRLWFVTYPCEVLWSFPPGPFVRALHFMKGLETAWGGRWSTTSLISSEQEPILLVDVADSASPNIKAMKHVGKFLAECPHLILYWAQRCIVHQMFRAIIKVLERLCIVKSLFCLSNVLHITSKADAFRRAVILALSSGESDIARPN